MVSLKSQRNPYVIGRPISERELFYGRDKELFFVWENFRKGEKVLFLHGERRIGKSSLLQNIPEFLDEKEYKGKYACVSFDLEYHGQNTLESLLERLAETIVKQLDIKPYQVEIPTAEEIKVQMDIFCNKFLSQIYAKLKDTKLVLLLDEFDALESNYIGATLESLFGQIQKVVESKSNQQLFAVIFAGRRSTDISNLLKIFNKVPIKEIGFIDDNSATKLITEPAASFLQYEQKSIEAIIKFSSGHPYFIQIICFALFSRARELEKWEVTEEDVELIIERAVELGEAGLAWYWEALSVPEKLVFSAVAESQKIAVEKQDQHLKQDPLKILEIYNFHHLSQDKLQKVVTELIYRGFINKQGNQVEIELVRRWLVQRHPLWQEVREFEKGDKQEIEQAYQIIDQLNQEKKSTVDIAESPKHQSVLEHDNLGEYFKNKDYNVYDFKSVKNLLPLKSTINQHEFPARGLGNIKSLADKITLNREEKGLLCIACIVALVTVIFLAFTTSNGKNDQNNYIKPQPYINSSP